MIVSHNKLVLINMIPRLPISMSERLQTLEWNLLFFFLKKDYILHPEWAPHVARHVGAWARELWRRPPARAHAPSALDSRPVSPRDSHVRTLTRSRNILVGGPLARLDRSVFMKWASRWDGSGPHVLTWTGWILPHVGPHQIPHHELQMTKSQPSVSRNSNCAAC